MLLQFLLQAVAKKKSGPLFDITLTYSSVNPSNWQFFMNHLCTVKDGGKNSFRGEWPERERAHGWWFFSENCHKRENNKLGEFPTKQARFCVEKYNGSLGCISIVINARVYSPGMSIGMSKVYSFDDAKYDIGDAFIAMFKIYRDKIIENEILAVNNKYIKYNTHFL